MIVLVPSRLLTHPMKLLDTDPDTDIVFTVSIYTTSGSFNVDNVRTCKILVSVEYPMELFHTDLCLLSCELVFMVVAVVSELVLMIVVLAF